jgi:hypothetical protein
MRSVTIRRVWKHVHDKNANPPCRYMVSYEDSSGLWIAEVLAIDELDAVKQFLKDK